MLNHLRVVQIPAELQISSSVLKGETLGFIADYDGIVNLANKKAQMILANTVRQAEEESEKIKNSVAKDVREDLKKMADFLKEERRRLVENSGEICAEISKVAIKKYVSTLNSEEKIEILVKSLLDVQESKMNICFSVSPVQSETLKRVLKEKFAKMIHVSDVEIEEDGTVEIDKLRIKRANGAFFELSIEYITAMLFDEIEDVQDLIQEELELVEKKNIF